MVVGLGIDLIETQRIEQALRRYGERFERRVYTEAERDHCRSRADRVLALAARFAAKEACLKALGTGWAGGIGFRDVELRREGSGRPRIELHGLAAQWASRRGITRIHVSLTHQPGMAAAVVVLEG